MNSKLLSLGGGAALQITGFSQVTNTTNVYMRVTVTGDPGIQYTMTNVSGTQTMPAAGTAEHIIHWSRPTCTNQSSNVSSTITAVEPGVIADGVPTTVTSSSVSGTTPTQSGSPPSVSPSSGHFQLSQGGSVTFTFSGGSNLHRVLGRISGTFSSTYFNGWSKTWYNDGQGSWTISWKAAGSGSRSLYMNYYYDACTTGTSAGFISPTVETI